jgi:hypothetical protein
MDNTREKLIEFPIDDAILILKEELKQRSDGYGTHLANGGKGDPAEEVSLDALAMAIYALEQTKWIPVTERLPEKWQNVLTVRTDGKFRFDFIGSLDVWYEDVNFVGYPVTHWMPLPSVEGLK